MTKTLRNSIIIGAAAIVAGAISIYLTTPRGRRTTEQLASKARELNRNIGEYADKYSKKGTEMIEKAKTKVGKQADQLMG
jgi:hypothetical protein